MSNKHRMGRLQHYMLNRLKTEGQWSINSNWRYRNNFRTKTILDSLVMKKKVFKIENDDEIIYKLIEDVGLK